MNIEKFQKVSKMVSVLLKIIVVFIFVFMIGAILLFFLGKDQLTVTTPIPTFQISFMSGNISEMTEKLVSLIVSILGVLTYVYVFFKGSQFFDRLSKGETPFSISNYEILRKIGIIIIIFNLASPLIYSLILTLSTRGGYFLVFGVDIQVVLGLIIYCIAEIIGYGIKLQELSDETV